MLWTICKKLGICILTFCCTFCLDYCITVTKVFIKVSRNAIFLYCNLDKLWICREQQKMSKTKIFKTWRFKGFLLPKLRTSQERISQNYLQNLTRYNWNNVLKHLTKNFWELSCLREGVQNDIIRVLQSLSYWYEKITSLETQRCKHVKS